MERYFFWLDENDYIYATYLAVNQQQVDEAIERGYPEVSYEDFVNASPLNRYVDGKMITPADVEQPEPEEPAEQPEPEKPYELRYFINVDDEDYITANIVAFSESEAEGYASSGSIEISKEVYTTLGPYTKYVDGKVVQGEFREPELSPEANQAIKTARISKASEMVSIYTDLTDPDLVESVDPDDQSKLLEWRKYRIALLKVDVSQKKPAWPDIPAE